MPSLEFAVDSSNLRSMFTISLLNFIFCLCFVLDKMILTWVDHSYSERKLSLSDLPQAKFCPNIDLRLLSSDIFQENI